MTEGNGVRQAVVDLGRQVERLWTEKASREALEYALEDIRELRRAIESIETMISNRVTERQRERDASARERKVDRRWMVGTVLTATGLVIAAMAILLPALTTGA